MLDVQLVPPLPIDPLVLITRDFSYQARDTRELILAVVKHRHTTYDRAQDGQLTHHR